MAKHFFIPFICLLAFTMCRKPEIHTEPSVITNPPIPPEYQLVDTVDMTSSPIPFGYGVEQMIFDSKDRLWVISEALKLYRYDPNTKIWTYFNSGSFQANLQDIFFGISEIEAGNGDDIYAIDLNGSNGYFYKYNGSFWQRDSVDSRKLYCIWFDKSTKTLWINSDKGVFEVNENQKRLHADMSLRNAKGWYLLYDLVGDKQGNIWVAGDEFVAKYDGSQWRKIELNRLANSYAVNLNIAIDNKNQIWTGVANYFHAYDGANITYNFADSLKKFDYSCVDAFINPKSDNVFLSSFSSEIMFIQPHLNKFKKINSKNTDFITQQPKKIAVAFDLKGDVWVGGNRFIGKLPTNVK